MAGMLKAQGEGVAGRVVAGSNDNGTYHRFSVAFVGATHEFYVDGDLKDKCRALEGREVLVEVEISKQGYKPRLDLLAIDEKTPARKAAAS